MSHIKARYKYKLGGWNLNQTQNFQQLTGLAGGFISELDNPESPSIGSGAASGALSGASLGAVAGPIGAAVGAGFGAVIGGISSKKKKEEIQAAKQRQSDLQARQFKDYSQSVLQSYPTQGVDIAGYYAKYGGKIPSFLAESLAEDKEVVMSNTPPETDENGELQQLASGVSKFNGDSHDDPSGGIGFNPTSDAYIFSDSLRTSEGLTFAKKAELLGKQKGKFEQKLESATTHAAKNTAELMIKKFDKKLADLFQEQETLKASDYGKI